ncbi:MAG: hypothetical protein M0T74_11185 [Desulfitobacterium hafniense]|nr:hypothetical protein [Desulfitobacterium hafniense]
MPKLEYRLAEDGYPAIYHYESIPREEIAVRFMCDYFVKDQVVYEKSSTANEGNLYIIYVKRSETEVPYSIKPSKVGMGYVLLEVREVDDALEDYPLLTTLEMPDLMSLLLYLQSDYIYVNDLEWERSSTEIDEDRFIYVMYTKRTN